MPSVADYLARVRRRRAEVVKSKRTYERTANVMDRCDELPTDVLRRIALFHMPLHEEHSKKTSRPIIWHPRRLGEL